MDGFNAHPAATDAATHFGALFDTEPSPAAAVAARPGRPAQTPCARVPVALETHSAQAARQDTGGGAELHAISDAASVSSVGTRRSSFTVCSGGGGGGAVLAGWQARPLSRGAGPATAAARAQATAADGRAMGAQLQQLASAAWVYETQWQATATRGHVGSPTPASCGSSRPTLVWNASSSSDDGSGGCGGCVALTQGALGACTAVLRLLQQQRARRLDLTVCSGSRAAHLEGISGCSTSSARAASSAAAAAAVLRTASAERHSAQCRLLVADGALGSLPAEVPLAEAEVCLAGTTAFVPRCHFLPGHRFHCLQYGPLGCWHVISHCSSSEPDHRSCEREKYYPHQARQVYRVSLSGTPDLVV